MKTEGTKESPRSRAQIMASHAWKTTRLVLERENFVQLAMGAPALVMANGLMQALAYWQSRGKEGGKALVVIIASWLLGKDKEEGFEELMKELHEASSSQFARYTREALELLRWVKQFASALEGKKES